MERRSSSIVPFTSFSSRQLDVHGVRLAVLLHFDARHVLERAEDPWLRGGVSDQVNGHLRTQRPKHRSRSVNSMVVAFLVLEATLALRIQKRERPYGMIADMCVHRTNVCRSALNGARHLARGNPPVLPIFSPLFTSDCRPADHLPSLTPYYWSSKHFDVPSVRF